MAHIVITGANRGIGLHLAKQYAARGDRVTAACRASSSDLDDLKAAHGVDVKIGVDVADDAMVSTFAREMGDKPTIDVLINNAGILSHESLDNLNFDAMRRQYEVNALGPLRVTNALRNRLQSGSKVGIVTSRVGSMEDNGSGGNYGYRMSKAAANMAGVNLMHDFKDQQIAVILLHPGYVNTDMTGGNGPTDPGVSAKGLIERIDALTMETTGSFWHAEGYQLPW